jgi:glycosyltransferase involved in cell wall biosynthesis
MPEWGHLRKRLGIPEQAMVLLFLGRLNRIKRPDIAIQVLAAAQSLPNEVHLLLAGPDEERLTQMLQSQAQNLGCADRLHMTGLLPPDGVLQALADADLLLMPSEIQENFGMSALEAMAAGVPILVSEGIPVGRWAEKEGAGRMVSCTTEAFVKATIELLSNPSKLRDMGERGRELAKQRFDISVVSHQMLAQYKSIVTNGYPLQDFREKVEDI